MPKEPVKKPARKISTAKPRSKEPAQTETVQKPARASKAGLASKEPIMVGEEDSEDKAQDEGAFADGARESR